MDPPLHHRHLLYHTNDPPTETEAISARHEMHELQRELSQINKEIASSSSPSHALLASQEGVKDAIKAYKGLLSPLRQFPTEMLSLIFINCLPKSPFSYSNTQSPIILEYVCRRWKDVCRSTPALWCYIDITSRLASVLRATTICLSRSGNFPLTVVSRLSNSSLSDAFAATTRLSAHTSAAVDLLLGQSERWLQLELTLMDEHFEAFLGVKDRLPLLQKLAIRTLTRASNQYTAFDFCTNAPMLRSFQWIKAGSKQISSREDVINVPWHQLTSLDIKVPGGPAGLWHILNDCQSLIDLQCDISRGHALGHHNLIPIKLPTVRFLSLTLPWTSHVLSTLTLPSLERACFNFHHRWPDVPVSNPVPWHIHSGFVALLSQSQCSIVALRLGQLDEHNYFRPEDLVPCLEAVPSLDHLELSFDGGITLIEELLYRLTIQSGAEACLLPRLTTLVIPELRGPFPDALFADFLRSRADHHRSRVERLQNVAIGDTDLGILMTRTLEMLSTLEAEGMRLNVGTKIAGFTDGFI